MAKSITNLLCILTLIISIGCNNGSSYSNTENKIVNNPTPLQIIKFESPYNGDKFAAGTTINIKLGLINDSIVPDSVRIYANGVLKTILKSDKLSYILDLNELKTGSLKIIAEAFAKNKKPSQTELNLKVVSKNKPMLYTYKVLNTYPHARDAYTQGLIFEKGFFYESDGQYDKSALRKVKLETGEAVNYAIMPPKVFAEGIALYKDKIFQITWQEQTYFVYNKKTFTLERQSKFDIDEGWGLTFDGNNFLMTDGSNLVYSLEPQSFTTISSIEVMDNEGPVTNLNELEYIDSKLYANIYQTNFIAIINPKTGEVTGMIDFTGLLPKSDYRPETDVLNGIAFNPENGHLFVTGKYWPKLFEVEIIKK